MNNPYNAPGADMSAHGGNVEAYQPRMFAMKGRIGRLRYIAYSIGIVLALSLALGIVSAVLAAMMGGANSAAMAMVIAVLVYIPMIAVGFIMAIRRVHDMGYSGWMSLVSLIPFVNLWLLFAPGTQGANEYGPPPVKNSTGVIVATVFVLLLMVVGVLAAVSIPAYQAYVMKAKAAQGQSAPASVEAAPE